MPGVQLRADALLILCPVTRAACRVWDIRTKVQVHCLSGHEDTVAAILALPTDPQVGLDAGFSACM